jgi:hypothetical protein
VLLLLLLIISLQVYLAIFAAAAIPSHQAPQITYLTHARLYCSSIELSLAK